MLVVPDVDVDVSFCASEWFHVLLEEVLLVGGVGVMVPPVAAMYARLVRPLHASGEHDQPPVYPRADRRELANHLLERPQREAAQNPFGVVVQSPLVGEFIHRVGPSRGGGLPRRPAGWGVHLRCHDVCGRTGTVCVVGPGVAERSSGRVLKT